MAVLAVSMFVMLLRVKTLLIRNVSMASSVFLAPLMPIQGFSVIRTADKL